jgi:hypothetical protein
LVTKKFFKSFFISRQPRENNNARIKRDERKLKL